MMIKTLELENIRSYKKEKIEFPEGVILFEGDIGSGKSTILYAIEFALFGLGDLKSAFILRNGAKEGSVALTAEIDGRDFVFQRALERKKSGVSQKECAIISGSSRREFSPEEMKREVLKLLKFNENPSPKATSFIYRYAVFTPQEAMKEILELPEDARLETLRRAFGIEEYRTARNNAAIVSKEIKDRETFLSGSLKDVDALVSEKKEKSGYVQKKRAEFSELEKQEKALEKALSEKRSKMDGFRTLKAESDRLEGALPRLRQSIDDKKTAVRDLEKSVSEIDAEVSEKRALIKKLEAEKRPTEKTDSEISDELKITREKMNSLSKSIGGLEKSVSETRLFEESLAAAGRELEILDKKIASLNLKKKPTDKTEEELSGEIKELRKRADELREKVAVADDSCGKLEKLINDGVCPFCGEKIDPEHFLQKAAAAQAELRKLEDMLKAVISGESEASKAKDDLIDFSRASEAFSAASKERDIMLKNRESAREKLAEIGALNQTLSRNLSLLKKLADEESRLLEISDGLKNYAMSRMHILEAMREIEKLKKRAESERHKIAGLNLEISKSSLEYESKKKEFDARQLILSETAALEKEIKTAEENRNMLLKSISSSAAEIGVLEAALEALSEKLLRKESEKKERDMLYEVRTWLDEYFACALASIEQHVLMSINDEFNSLFRKWFGLLMADTEISVSINDAFTPTVVQNGYEQDMRALSGGEKTSVALAYRLALNTVVKRVCSSMNSSGLIILDEPTDGFSKEQLNHLRDVFLELACRQIILVSHERELEAFSDRVFRIVKEGSASKILRA